MNIKEDYMKRLLKCCLLILSLFMVVGCGSKKDYTEQINGLNGQRFLMEGDTDTSIKSISFDEGKAVVLYRSFDGNRIHDDEAVEYTISADDENIILSSEGKDDISFAYTFENGETTLNDSALYTADYVDEAIQGCWFYDNIIKGKVESHYVHSLKIDNGEGEYGYGTATYSGKQSLVNYMGHQEGSYTVGDGEITFDFMHGEDFFFSIKNGKVSVYYFGDKMQSVDFFLDEKAFKKKY